MNTTNLSALRRFCDRLRWAMEWRRCNQAQLGAQINRSQSVISRLLNVTDDIHMTPRTLDVAQALDISAEWLGYGSGDPLTPEDDDRRAFLLAGPPSAPAPTPAATGAAMATTSAAPPPVALPDDTTPIPRYDLRAWAGNGAPQAEVAHTGNINVPTARVLQITEHPENLEIYQVYGDSMAPTIQPGEHILVDTGAARRRPVAGEVWCFERVDFGIRVGFLLKRIFYTASGDLMLMSDNPVFGTILVPANDMDSIHRIGKAHPLASGITYDRQMQIDPLAVATPH